MKLEYTLTLDDYKASYRLLYRRSLFSQYDYVIFPLVALISGLLLKTVALGGLIHFAIHWIFLFTAISSFAVPITKAFSPTWGYRRNHGKGNTSHQSVTEITPTNIIDAVPGVREISYPWSAVIGFGQDERITLLRRKGSSFTIFPTSVLNPAQRAELDLLVSRSGVRRWS